MNKRYEGFWGQWAQCSSQPGGTTEAVTEPFYTQGRPSSKPLWGTAHSQQHDQAWSTPRRRLHTRQESPVTGAVNVAGPSPGLGSRVEQGAASRATQESAACSQVNRLRVHRRSSACLKRRHLPPVPCLALKTLL